MMIKVNLSLKFYIFYAILQMVGISYVKCCLVNFESKLHIWKKKVYGVFENNLLICIVEDTMMTMIQKT